MTIKKKDIEQFFLALVLIIVPIRGFFIYYFDIPAQVIYKFTFVLMIFFALYVNYFLWTKIFYKELTRFQNLIKFNFVFSFLFIFVKLLLGSLTISDLYIFIFFPITLLVIEWPVKKFLTVIFYIIIITSFGIINFKLISITDFHQSYEIHEILRPDKNQTRVSHVSHLGGSYSSGGFQASNHDAANILSMLTIFTLIYGYTCEVFKKSFFWIAISLLSFIAILFTNSATNVVVIHFSIFLFVLSVFFRSSFLKKIKYLIIIFLLFHSLLWLDASYFNNSLFVVFNKILNTNLILNNPIMLNLSYENLIQSFFGFFFGFAYEMRLPIIHSEIAFIKILFGRGVVLFVITCLILFSPLFFIWKAHRILKLYKTKYKKRYNQSKIEIKKLNTNLYFFSIPVLTGSLTLLHYGSLFRLTSIGIWCLLLGFFLKQYINLRQKINY